MRSYLNLPSATKSGTPKTQRYWTATEPSRASHILPVSQSISALAQAQRIYGNRRMRRVIQLMQNTSSPTMLLRQVAGSRRIDYGNARRANQKYAASLGWGARLVEFQPTLAQLWNSDKYNEFANSVADFQEEQEIPIDGTIGPLTWNRIKPIGEVVASQRSVSWDKSRTVCTIAAQERLEKGYKHATGERLVPAEAKDDFRVILQSDVAHLLEVDEEFRGTGAAGGLVYLGAGEFVSQDAIWDEHALKPGAALQVWKKQSDLENLRKGKQPESWGTSFVFLEYVGDDAMRVLHYDRVERVEKSKFETWIAANL